MPAAACPTCGRRLVERRRRHAPPLGQLELDWSARYWARREPRPYPFAALARRLPRGLEQQARLLRVSWATLARMRSEGLTLWQADRAAGQLGAHPTELWPEWGIVDDDLS